jgi:hypothetical protein
MYIKNFIGIVWLFLEIKIPKFLCKGPASNGNGKGSDWNGNGNANEIAMDTPCRERERDICRDQFL